MVKSRVIIFSFVTLLCTNATAGGLFFSDGGGNAPVAPRATTTGGLFFGEQDKAKDKGDDAAVSGQSAKIDQNSETYAPQEPPRASMAPVMSYGDPVVSMDLSQQPGESEDQYLKRSKEFYEKSSAELKSSMDDFNRQMRALSPKR